MPKSHGLMLNLAWKDFWSCLVQPWLRAWSLITLSWRVLDFLEGNILERSKKQKFCVQGTLGGGAQGDRVGITHSSESMILEVFSSLGDPVRTEIPFVLCCSHRCHLPAGGRFGPKAAAPHSEHPREQLQEVTQEGQPSSGVCQGWGQSPAWARGGSSKRTKYKQ